MQKRDNFWLLSRRHPENEEHIRQYKKYRNLINQLIVIAKEGFYKEKIEQTNGDIKQIWKVTNEITGKVKQRKSIDKIQNSNHQVLTPPKKIANEFNNFFIKVGKALASKIDKNVKMINISEPRNNNSLFWRPVNSMEIIETINSLKNNTVLELTTFSLPPLKQPRK